MWILKGPKGENYYLLPGTHAIGRKNCDLILDEDQSISRTHATIHVSHPSKNWTNPSDIPIVNLCDVGSKYGTTVLVDNNTIKAEKDTTLDLKQGTIIQFGLQFNKWQLYYEPLVVVVSSLPKGEKQKLRSVIGELGGYVLSDWHFQTSHLVMLSFTMTVKAITALANAIPIVTPQYWHSYKTAIQTKIELPKYEDFLPVIGETVLNEHSVSFLVNTKRKSLFNGKSFFFFSENQLKDLGSMIEAAGGITKLVRNVTQLSQYAEKNSVAVQLLSTSSQTQTCPSQLPNAFLEVCEFLKTLRKRMIPASEIGLAILHCSVEKYCNPDFNFSTMLLQSSENVISAVSENVLASETQDNTEPYQISQNGCKIIPDSGSESKLGMSLSEVNCSVQRPKITQEFVEDSQNATQIRSCILTPEIEITNKGNKLSGYKRLRVINSDDDDDVIDVSSPKKPPAHSTSNSHKKFAIISEEISNSVEFSTTVSSRATSRLNGSKRLYNDEQEDPDELFVDFIETQPKSRIKIDNQREKSDIDADDLFADFQNEPSTITQKSSVVVLSRESISSTKSSFCVTSAKKRNLELDYEIGPPEKRFAKLELSREQDNSNLTNKDQEEDIEFMPTNKMKAEDQSSSVKSIYNVSIVFKPLIVCKTEKSTVASAESTLMADGIANYKKFRKVNPTSNVLPHIIGGRDLLLHQNVNGSTSLCSDTKDYTNDSEEEDDPNSLWSAITQNNRSQKRAGLWWK